LGWVCPCFFPALITSDVVYPDLKPFPRHILSSFLFRPKSPASLHFFQLFRTGFFPCPRSDHLVVLYCSTRFPYPTLHRRHIPPSLLLFFLLNLPYRFFRHKHTSLFFNPRADHILRGHPLSFFNRRFLFSPPSLVPAMKIPVLFFSMVLTMVFVIRTPSRCQ